LTLRQLRIAKDCFAIAVSHFRQLFAYLQTQWDPAHLKTATARARQFRFSSGPLVMSDPWTRWNLDVVERGYDDEHELRGLVRQVSDNTMVSYDALTSLARLVRYCETNAIDGAFVELGVWRGGCLGMMTAANLKFGARRRDVYGFDSFEGLPELNAAKDFDGSLESEFAVNENASQGKLRAINALTAPQEAAENLIVRTIGYPAERLQLHKGWFQDTLPGQIDRIGPIAILRFDCDLYDSYRFCLPLVWDRVVPGGFIVIDDWCLKGCREAVEEFLQSRNERPYLFPIDYTVRMLQKAQ
jgi:hypothetical protein